MKSLGAAAGAAAGAALLLACAACAAFPEASGAVADGASAVAAVLPVVTFTPAPNQPAPDTLTQVSPFLLASSVRSGFACFTMAGVPVIWPRGFSAVRTADGTLEVRDRSGRVVRTGGARFLDQMTVQSAGSACSGRGQDITVILSLPAPG